MSDKKKKKRTLKSLFSKPTRKIKGKKDIKSLKAKRKKRMNTFVEHTRDQVLNAQDSRQNLFDKLKRKSK